MSVPTFDEFLRAQLEADLETEAAEARSGYAIWPLNRAWPSVKSMYPNAPPGERVVEPGHRPPNHWAIKVRLGRDSRRFTFTVPTKRDAENLGRLFLKQLREYLDDESADMLWNKFVLAAARHVDAKLKQVCGLDPPSTPVKGPTTESGHAHEWHWTGSWSEARPFPVWHMRCECGFWSLLGNQVGTVSGEWVAFDEAVHDIRKADGSPLAYNEPQGDTPMPHQSEIDKLHVNSPESGAPSPAALDAANAAAKAEPVSAEQASIDSQVKAATRQAEANAAKPVEQPEAAVPDLTSRKADNPEPKAEANSKPKH